MTSTEDIINKYLKIRKEHDELEEKIKNMRMDNNKLRRYYDKTDD